MCALVFSNVFVLIFQGTAEALSKARNIKLVLGEARLSIKRFTGTIIPYFQTCAVEILGIMCIVCSIAPMITIPTNYSYLHYNINVFCVCSVLELDYQHLETLALTFHLNKSIHIMLIYILF